MYVYMCVRVCSSFFLFCVVVVASPSSVALRRTCPSFLLHYAASHGALPTGCPHPLLLINARWLCEWRFYAPIACPSHISCLLQFFVVCFICFFHFFCCGSSCSCVAFRGWRAYLHCFVLPLSVWWSSIASLFPLFTSGVTDAAAVPRLCCSFAFYAAVNSFRCSSRLTPPLTPLFAAGRDARPRAFHFLPSFAIWLLEEFRLLRDPTHRTRSAFGRRRTRQRGRVLEQGYQVAGCSIHGRNPPEFKFFVTGPAEEVPGQHAWVLCRAVPTPAA